ncbi:hypothetical protein GCM10023172_40720 [Hymenobacter ginsengisoli]|uniref:Uncharacterized protein n=1 Tax=Hymenobacter ginsengisoli TaxID=1051626 RepID=A0ABP8QS92_9BACT|nr:MULTISPECIES: hypothetical protein [unclassified Hymenobacter]MBO2032284.1 hypothetical protein [Hymenobacter sp. BT559]
MTRFSWLAALAVAAPLCAAAQTKPTAAKPTATTTSTKPATQEVKETVEELDPATGKVIRRTTRTYNVPAGTAASGGATTTASPASPSSSSSRTEDTASTPPASDTAVSAFLREKVVVGTTTAPQLLRLYKEFIETVREERSGWKPADWERAAAVLSSLNARYDQLRSSFSLDDKLTIRSQQGEFQTLRTARQLSDQISNKL